MFHIAGDAGEIRAAPGRQVVEHADLAAGGKEAAHDMGADESCATSDQYPHGSSTSATGMRRPARKPIHARSVPVQCLHRLVSSLLERPYAVEALRSS